MGIMVYALLCVMQDLYHQPYFLFGTHLANATSTPGLRQLEPVDLFGAGYFGFWVRGPDRRL